MLFIVAALLVVALINNGYALTTVRFGSHVVSEGDSTKRVLESAGHPTRIADIVNKHGTKTGERWEYDLTRSMVTITIVEGRVLGVEEIPD